MLVVELQIGRGVGRKGFLDFGLDLEFGRLMLLWFDLTLEMDSCCVGRLMLL